MHKCPACANMSNTLFCSYVCAQRMFDASVHTIGLDATKAIMAISGKAFPEGIYPQGQGPTMVDVQSAVEATEAYELPVEDFVRPMGVPVPDAKPAYVRDASPVTEYKSIDALLAAAKYDAGV